MFKNVDYQWLPLNQELAVTHVFHWPTQVACPDPKNYQFDTKNLATGIVVATLT
jgi:hypothetical protein